MIWTEFQHKPDRLSMALRMCYQWIVCLGDKGLEWYGRKKLTKLRETLKAITQWTTAIVSEGESWATIFHESCLETVKR